MGNDNRDYSEQEEAQKRHDEQIEHASAEHFATLLETLMEGQEYSVAAPPWLLRAGRVLATAGFRIELHYNPNPKEGESPITVTATSVPHLLGSKGPGVRDEPAMVNGVLVGGRRGP